YGTYNVTNGGPATSWADVASAVFAHSGRAAEDVGRISSADYAAGKELAPRPASSVLPLSKLESTGFVPTDAMTALRDYVTGSAPAEG
ncbi:MAG: NAD-dependent epimerase/dehydratase family protein, partial [Nocardioides sp.]|nr:NAD-dependent epimerase/dehydratase family protein [Nocardioides sp.]